MIREHANEEDDDNEDDDNEDDDNEEVDNNMNLIEYEHKEKNENFKEIKNNNKAIKK